MNKILIENEKDFVKEKANHLLDKICVMFMNNSDIIYIFCYDDLIKEIDELFNIKSIKEMNKRDIALQLRSDEFNNAYSIGRLDLISRT